MDKINWLEDVSLDEVKEKTQDDLASEVLRRYNGAVSWQSSDHVNGKTLRQVLRECWEQQNGLLDAQDQKVADELGVNVVVNLTALKTGIANAYLTDALISGNAELPWLISPTPRPDISVTAKDELMVRLKDAIFNGEIVNSDVLIELIRSAKQFLARREKEQADKASREMLGLLQDQCAEGGFSRAMTDFLQYFPVYPFAVFSGPYITRAPRLIWGKEKPRLSTEVYPVFKAINPFDFCYSPDSPDTQRGTCVFTREHWTRKELLDAAKLPTYIQANVLELLKECDHNGSFALRWLSHAPDAPNRDINLWASNVQPIEVLHHYGTMSGRELSAYGFSDLDNTEFYQCEIVMAGYRVIMVKVIRDPRLQTRPIYTASFYRTGGDKIAGDGIAQRIRDIERAYLASLRYLLRNSYLASAPMCEVDYNRLAKYMGDNDLGHIVPGLMYLIDSNVSQANNPAMKFFPIPANIDKYGQLLELFMQLADRVTNIPAQLHGEAVGSGAMRTFRGMSMLQGSATKALHASVENLTYGVFEPLGNLLYNYNMLYSPDQSIKGDSQIIVKGASGLLAKEIAKQESLEVLEILSGVGAQLSQVVNLSPVLSWCIKNLFQAMNVPDDLLEQMNQMPMQQPMQPMQQPVASSPNPNSNPNPGEDI